jgi:cytochrome c5
VRGPECGVRSAVRRAGCWVLSAVLGAGCGVLGAEGRGLRAERRGLRAEGGVLGAQQSAAPAALPEGDGAEVVRSRCLVCHGADLIVSQRLDDAGWGREVDKMIRWGAAVAAVERTRLIAYLARQFAPAPAVSHARAAEGEAVFKRACLTCHGADLAQSQHLTLTGWTREVEKMMRWGAKVTDAEKPALAEYLASLHPTR